MHESSGDNMVYDPQLPLFSTVSGGYSASELARILMNKDIDTNKVCNIQPLGVVKNATFIVDIDQVPLKRMILVRGGTMEQSQRIFPCLQMDQYG